MDAWINSALYHIGLRNYFFEIRIAVVHFVDLTKFENAQLSPGIVWLRISVDKNYQ